MKVLLVDDDRDLIDLLRYTFQRDGYSVAMALDGEMALRMLPSESPDLVVLDLMLPKRDGMQVLKEMRASWNIPVIVLTALGDEDHVVDALELGADDYMVKPFRPRELRARAHALLRRNQDQARTRDRIPQPIVLGDVKLDPASRSASVGERPIRLSRTEFSLLHYLMLHRNMARSLPDIMANVWGYNTDDNDEVVKVTVSRLRRKLETDPARPQYVVNVPGVGYMFQCDL